MSSSSELYSAYLKSWSDEINARSNRIRQLIGDSHWLSDGSHKEYIIREFLERYVPSDVEVGHGFIRTIDGNCSNEIDILVNRCAGHPPYFKEGGLMVLPPEAVIATLEIKTSFQSKELKQALSRQARTHMIYRQAAIDFRPWQGVIFYKTPDKFDASKILNVLKQSTECLLRESATKQYDPLSSRRYCPPVPTCVAILDGWLAWFRLNQDLNRITISLFDAKGLSFPLAVIDFLGFLHEVTSGSVSPIAFENSKYPDFVSLVGQRTIELEGHNG